MPSTDRPQSPPTVAVVIPCYRESAHILDVNAAIGDEVRHIFVVLDFPMMARYGDEQSGIRIRQAFFEFAAKNGLNAFKRILISYFVRDFSIFSIELVLGKLMVLFGMVFGAIKWHDSAVTGVPATAGTVILAALPIIVGMQMLLAFLNYDIRSVPRTPIHPML